MGFYAKQRKKWKNYNGHLKRFSHAKPKSPFMLGFFFDKNYISNRPNNKVGDKFGK